MKVNLDMMNEFDAPGLTDRNIRLERFKSLQVWFDTRVCIIPKVVDFVTDINLPII